MNLYITLFLVVRACFYYRGGFGFVLLRGFSSLEVSLIFAFYIWGPDDLVRHLCPEMFFPVLYIYGIQSISFKIDFASLCGAMAWAGCLVHPANHANLMPQHNLVAGSMAAVQSISSSWVVWNQQSHFQNHPESGREKQAGKFQKLSRQKKYETRLKWPWMGLTGISSCTSGK